VRARAHCAHIASLRDSTFRGYDAADAMRTATRTILPLLLLGAPALAAAQQAMPGLDLSSPARPATPPEVKSPARAAEPGTPLERAVGVPGESDAALEDRVKAVQLKGFLKRERFQLSLLVTPTLNDAFYQKLGVGGLLGYNFTEGFGIGLRGAYWFSFKTQYVQEGTWAFQGQLLQSQLYGTAMLDLLFTPVYGKFAWLGKSIVRFDAYAWLGGGLAWTATSGPPRDQGAHLAGELGVGIRFYPLEWLSLELAAGGTFYADQPDPALPAAIQKVVGLSVGGSLFFPTRFEYRTP
jgi:outer membrane beta-barrel protein